MATVKMGVIGCGAIAQVHHMPNLSDLPDLFKVTAVCDVSRGAADFVASKTGAKVLVLPPSVGGTKGLDDYIQLMTNDIHQLAATL